MLISLGLLKKTSRKQFTISNTKIVLIHCIISLVIFFSIVATFKGGSVPILENFGLFYLTFPPTILEKGLLLRSAPFSH